MRTLNIYLLRHGETAWNADNNRYCGRTDIALTEKGIRQAERVRTLLQHTDFEAVFSSPLQRAATTALIASGKEPSPHPGLIELDFGKWEGKTKEEFIGEDPQCWNNWMQDPYNNRAGGNGETGREVVERADAFFNTLRKSFHGGNIMVVAHNGLNRLFMAYKLGMPLANYRQLVQENSAITMFTLDKEGWFQLCRLNG